jgi:hypothetical protein
VREFGWALESASSGEANVPAHAENMVSGVELMRRSREMVLEVLIASLSLRVSDVIHNPLQAQRGATKPQPGNNTRVRRIGLLLVFLMLPTNSARSDPK